MTKEHKKLYKAGKNWIVATLTATTITLLGGIGAYTVHADTTIESSQDVQTTSVNQTNQVDNSNNSVTINQPVAVQSSQAADTSNSDSLDSNIYGTVQSSQNNNSNNSVVLNQPVTTQSNSTVKNSQPVQNTPITLTVTAATNNSSELDPNIYGTVNVKDWDYQTENNILNITGYHGSNKMHMTIPNLNDFAKSGLNIDNVNCVGLSSAVAKELVPHEFEHDKIGRQIFPSLAISKTSGRYSDKVIATDSDWSGAFSNPYLRHADLTNLDTSNITNMSQMFASTNRLKSLKGLDNWDTSHVTDMSQMFASANELDSLEGLNNWDTSKVTNMSGMFNRSSATSLNLNNWDTSKVTNMSGMFNRSSATSLNLSNWDTSKVTNMANMFLFDESLTSIGDLSNWNTSNVTNMANMFEFDESLTSIGDLSHWDTSNVTNMANMFSQTSLQTVGDLSHWDTHNVTNMQGMFAGSKFKTLNLTNWNTSKVTDMSYMFEGCNLQTGVDLSHWDTHNVTNMSYMFEGLISPTIGNIGNWNTSKVTDMSYMFGGCNPQTGIDLSHWDTHNVTNMSDMFERSKFKTLNLTNWNTSKVTDMSEMFKDASNLQTVGDLSNWDISKVTKMPRMFENASSLQSVGNLSKWNTDSLIDPDVFLIDFPVRDMFSGSNLPYFYTSNRQDDGYYRNDGYYKNQVRLIDQKGLMGQPGTTVAIIDTPTFYQQLNGKSKEDSVVATITPLVEKEANKIYQQFRSNLPKGMQLIYPDKVSLKMIYSDDIDDLANAIFVFNMNKNVVINYVDQDGKVIKTDTISDKVGDQINVKLSLPDGYELANKDEQIPSSITVGEDGIKPITIQVKKLPVVQTGSINYVDQDGKVIKTDTISGKVGDQINVKLSLPDGYELANKDEQVPSTITVGDDGIKTIIINIKKIPVIKTGSINYVDQNGKIVKTDKLTGKVGNKIKVTLSLPDGYELANKDEQVPSVITVTENGIGTINVNVKKINTTNTGWNQQGDDWLYMQKNGHLAKGWNYLNGHWFYFDLQSGIMKTGIQSIGNSFYYLNAQHDGTYGAMKTGWQFVNGHWIGLQGSGNALTGWQTINGHWYYFDPQTAYALTNWQDINNHWYYFDPTNAWAQTGWFKSGAGYWYFFDYANAWADTGWQKINNSWYYFDNVNANALTGWQSINNHWYYFDPTNAWALTGWQWINGHWYWFDQANAWARTGWQYYGGQWYFMDQQNAWMDTGWTTNLANGQLYYLDKNGHPLTGWQRSLNGFWYYLQPGSDAAAIGWNWINGHWYYFNPEETINGTKAKGAMLTGHQLIANRWSYFDQYGHWLGYEN
ncbi:BspA family leucine-rich repeat surface protein [Limosilactobacillus vaginalis]|uniref:BspA family leucine-rich repeat surface protein n=2 Tax=Limosilactobacillus TaxID=2742598 RepID=UPI0025A45379|nr:BspA family leucine-rich repeat surface protein [Limosilactobacillus vaginalis]MDM8265316.1 BspA family leucine-rich repeat surface protein [Limosilactobacillus vaginalis]